MLCSRKHFLKKYFFKITLKIDINSQHNLTMFVGVCISTLEYTKTGLLLQITDEQFLQLYRLESWACSFVVKKKNGTHFQKYFACLYIMLYIMPRNVSWSQFFLTITQYDSYGVASLLHIIIQNNQVSSKNVSQQQ